MRRSWRGRAAAAGNEGYEAIKSRWGRKRRQAYVRAERGWGATKTRDDASCPGGGCCLAKDAVPGDGAQLLVPTWEGHEGSTHEGTRAQDEAAVLVVQKGDSWTGDDLTQLRGRVIHSEPNSRDGS